MTDQTNRPTVTSTGLITAAIALTLPFLADRFILSAMSEARDVGVGAVIGMAVYTAAPFLLLDSAMRPRRRVRLALWMGLALTVILWVEFARTGHAFQAFTGEGNAFIQSCKETAKDLFSAIVSGSGAERTALMGPSEKCVAAYDKSGSAHVGFYMLTMMWPVLVIGIMGAAAKIAEPKLPETHHAA